MPERLHKSTKDKVLFGVAGGLAEYLNIDPVLVRVGFVVLAFASGIGILAYILLALLMPSAPVVTPLTPSQPLTTPPPESAPASPPVVHQPSADEERRRRNTIGATLILLGLVFLVFTLNLFRLNWGRFWPLLLILAGVLLIAGRIGRTHRG